MIFANEPELRGENKQIRIRKNKIERKDAITGLKIDTSFHECGINLLFKLYFQTTKFGLCVTLL